MSTATKAINRRLASLDILRGLDLFLLLFLQPVMLSIGAVYDAGWYQSVLYQLDHEVWEGFRCWDLVMPLFLFMVGAAMPFSLSKYTGAGHQRREVYGRILRRVVLLFVLGMVVQGNLLGFSADTLKIYNNTLQAIAAGYLIASLTLLHVKSITGQALATVLLMVIYSSPMAAWGSYGQEQSFAFEVDRLVLGDFRGDISYTWVWSSLTFGATVMLGAIAGRLMKDAGSAERQRAAWQMVIIGMSLIAIGLAFGQIEPIIKRLWTSSMTLLSAGICFELMALAYWWIDIRGRERGLGWLKIYGMNAILAYCVGEVVNFRSIVQSLTYGLQHLVGDWYDVVLTLGNSSILLILLYILYRRGIYLRV